MTLKPNRSSGFSLVEVVIASAILAIVMLGVGSSYTGIQSQQAAGRQRQAAMLAAMSILEEIQVYADANPLDYPAILDRDADDATAGLYNQFPFHVYNAASSASAGSDGSMGATGTGSTLKPADDADLFPASRALGGTQPWNAINGPDAVTNYAGYIEITLVDPADPAIRPSVRQVTVYVAWKGFGGDERLSYTVMIGPKE